MITIRRAADRLHTRRGEAHVWTSVPTARFAELVEFEHELLPPSALLLSKQVAETVLYLCSGALERSNSDDADRLLAGVFLRVAEGSQPRSNNSTDAWAGVYRIRLQGTNSGREQSRDRVWFSAAERRGRLRPVASSNTDGLTLWIPQRAVLYSALLDPGQHVVCEIDDSHGAWVHMVHGSAVILDEVLETSDSAEIDGVRAFGLTAREPSEVLILELPTLPIAQIDDPIGHSDRSTRRD